MSDANIIGGDSPAYKSRPGFAPFSRISCTAAAGALTTDCPPLRCNVVQLYTAPAYKSKLLTRRLYTIDGRQMPSVNQLC